MSKYALWIILLIPSVKYIYPFVLLELKGIEEIFHFKGTRQVLTLT